jgi:serine/threonine protein kinase
VADEAAREAQPRPATNALRLLLQTCRGVAQLHGHGLSHGDIKPSNVLLSAEGVAKAHARSAARTCKGCTQIRCFMLISTHVRWPTSG